MKVLGISGTPRKEGKSGVYTLVQQVLDQGQQCIWFGFLGCFRTEWRVLW